MNLNPKVYPIDEYGALFDAHIHTYFDFHDGLITPDQLINATIQKGFNWVLAMAHDTCTGSEIIRRKAEEKNLPTITGIEISTTHNHLLAFGLQEWKVQRDSVDPDEAIELLRQQDAAIFLSHPYTSPKSIDYGHWFPELVKRMDIDGLEWYNATTYFFNNRTQKIYPNFPEGRKIAGTDAHTISCFGYSYTQVDINSQDPDDLVSAMQKGNCTPYCKSVPIIQLGYAALKQTIKNKLLKQMVVEGRDIHADGDRPLTRIAKGLKPHNKWTVEMLKKPIIPHVEKWIS